MRREQFPRFYFVSDADLLTLITFSTNPSKTVVHIHKIFSDIDSVQLDRESSVGDSRPRAVSFASFSGESVSFDQVTLICHYSRHNSSAIVAGGESEGKGE